MTLFETRNTPRAIRSPISVMVVILGALTITGCASDLKVWDKNKAAAKGVPFRTAELYVRSGIYTKHSKLKDCVPAPFVKTTALPTGALYYVNVDTAQMAKTSFTVKLHDNGTLSEVTMNSEPSSAGIDSITNALTELLPFAGVLPEVQPDEAEVAVKAIDVPDGPACNTGEKGVKFTRFSEWPNDTD